MTQSSVLFLKIRLHWIEVDWTGLDWIGLNGSSPESERPAVRLLSQSRWDDGGLDQEGGRENGK